MGKHRDESDVMPRRQATAGACAKDSRCTERGKWRRQQGGGDEEAGKEWETMRGIEGQVEVNSMGDPAGWQGMDK
jgi:hypothetical protein